MTLDQFHDLKLWRLRHRRDHPVENQLWDMVLTLWLVGWLGLAASLVLVQAWAVVLCIGLVALPNAYVELRKRLHSARRLRCDWIVVLR